MLTNLRLCILSLLLCLLLSLGARAADFTLSAPGATNNPWAPSNVIVPVSTIRSDLSPNSFRAGVTGTYAVFAHDATYGATIVSEFTMNAVHASDDWYIGAVVRTGGNAGAFLGVRCLTTGVSVVTVTPAAAVTAISTSASWPTTAAANDVDAVTVAISGGVATITLTQNGLSATFSANTTSTYAAEASLAAGGGFNPQNNNTTRVSQFQGTGVSAAGGTVISPLGGGGGTAAHPVNASFITELLEHRTKPSLELWKLPANVDQFKARALQ